MSELTWTRIAQTTEGLAGHLLNDRPTDYASTVSPICTKDITTWITELAASPFPEFLLPRDPTLRTELLVRLQYATALAKKNEQQRVPLPSRLDQAALFKQLLIQEWDLFVKNGPYAEGGSRKTIQA